MSELLNDLGVGIAGPDAYPTHVEFGGFKPGDVPTTRITYQCDSLEAAMRVIHRAAETHSTIDSTYDRETGVLVLVLQ